MARPNTVSFEDFQFSPPPQRRKRHPIRSTIITLVVLAVLLVAAYLVAEPLTEQFAKGVVQAGVAKELGANDSDVHVDLGKGSIILQLINHKIKNVHVIVDSFTSGNLSGSAVFTARGVPLDANKPISNVGITVSLGADALRTLVTSSADPASTTVAFAGSNVRLGTTVSVLGATLPASVDLAPSAPSGQLVLTPAAITIGTAHYTTAQLQASPLGALVPVLLAPRTECVSASLPNGLTLRSVSVKGARLLVGVNGTGLSLSSLSHKGTCPAG